MFGLGPEERNRRIEEIYRLVQSLRQPAPGLQITGCREAAVPLLVILIVLLLAYVFSSLGGQARQLILGLVLFIAVMFLMAAFVSRATR